jgi:protein SCO1/2
MICNKVAKSDSNTPTSAGVFVISHSNVRMSKKSWLYLVIFGVILAGFYGGLMAFTDFGKKTLPILATVMPYSFTRHDGRVVSDKDVAGRVHVVEFFFTTCKGICPKMNRNMKDVHERLKGESGFLILSHTVDPDTDSVAVLRRYADSIGATLDTWWFLTGTKETLYKSARQSYLLDNPENNSNNVEDQFIHTQFFAVVDREGRVRGIYDGLKKDEVEQLVSDVRILLKEGARSSSTPAS